MNHSRVILTICLVALLYTIVLAAESDNSALLNGVNEIAAPGVPGPLCVFGRDAFVVAAGRAGKAVEPVVAAAGYGKGRIVVFGHDGYFGKEALSTADTGRLMTNAVYWASGSIKGKTSLQDVGVFDAPDLSAFLHSTGIRVQNLTGQDWSDKLGSIGVLCISPSRITEKDITAIDSFVSKGGGLIVSGLGWGWLQLNPGKTLLELPGNRLISRFGILWADGVLEQTSEKGFSAKNPPGDLCNAVKALNVVAASAKDSTKTSPEDLFQAAWTVTRAVMTLPVTDKTIMTELHRLLKEHHSELIPIEEKPLTNKDPLARLLLVVQVREMMDLPASQVKPHPAADFFPGKCPVNASGTIRQIEVDTGIPGWHSTGVYAAPGEHLVVVSPLDIAGKGFNIRIGCHSDTIWEHEKWLRVPDISRVFKIDSPKITAANPFGGLVYVVVPDGCKLGNVRFIINGGTKAPHFVLGKTGLSDWQKLRNSPAPWAELETKKVVLTVPSSVVRGLDDPEDLMKFWDRISDACAELAGLPFDRLRPERYVADIQIGGLGYMHSGYPIMTHLDIAPVEVDKAKIMANGHGGVWGLFHEMGHNHQSGDWTFEGAGEVTVNLFTLYVYDKVIGIKAKDLRDFNDEGRARRIIPYLAEGAPFAKWQSDPFLALIMYIQLQEAFGWDVYKKVFAEYLTLPDSERPKTEQEKRDQWLVRLSRTVGKNLGPFFQVWGVPTSKKAQDSISNLPVWMPDGFPPKQL